MSSNRRKRERIPFPIPVDIYTDTQKITGTLNDVSMSGALLHCETSLDLGSEATICMRLDCGNLHQVIKAQCHVVRRETSNGLAVHFSKLDSEDSLTLFQCIRYQAMLTENEDLEP